MAEVIEINDIHELGAYRMAWKALFAETPDASFFHTFDWLSIYWQHYGEGQKLRVLVVKAAGQVIGIVPLCVRRQRHKVGVVRTLCYPLDGWGNVFGPIGANQAATLALAMKHIAQTPRDWDNILLSWVAHDTTDRGRTHRAMDLSGLRPELGEGQSTSVIDLAEDWEDYLASRNSKTRHELRRHLRRIDELDGVEYVRHRPAALRAGDGDPAWDLYEMCEQVAAESWQSTVDDGNTLTHNQYRDFYRDTHAAAARLGMVDMNLLLVKGEPIAFNYNYHHNRRLVGLRMGYDKRHPKYGAGYSLIAKLLKDSCARGDEFLDLGIGEQDFKRRIRTRQHFTQQLTYSPLTSWRCQVLRFGHWLRREPKLAAKQAS